ncbi:MAG TPA: MotA/TolQ/ExbB proton channel family protein [Candidatus Hydrogenedentes bacterium]|nr:MotA/TolQ/ExbB proton channel family protein [Candidatus Hydrogenedentota bacterium]HNT86276.1 MotA/TolQ/ExbB proton channel family protein [Candidatus Hydrogenedentota bacterium]
MCNKSHLVAGILLTSLVLAPQIWGQEPPDAAPEAGIEAPPAAVDPVPPIPGTRQPAQQLTLEMMVRQGGPILWVIAGLGFIALVLALYLLLTVTPRREAPATLVKRAHAQVRAGDLRGAYQMCEGRDELLANVLRAGLQMAGHDRYVIQDAMESEGERGAAGLWQKISYLNNIATIAPLLGLLGTVWGMMQAFSTIAFDDAQVKGIAVAYSVSMAMVTTAAGLILAIPAMAIYYYLRGRVVKILAEVEAEASELVELMARSPES